MMQLLTSRSPPNEEEQESLFPVNPGQQLYLNWTKLHILCLSKTFIQIIVESLDYILSVTDVLERSYLRQVHNCVYFAVKVLENQFQ